MMVGLCLVLGSGIVVDFLRLRVFGFASFPGFGFCLSF